MENSQIMKITLYCCPFESCSKGYTNKFNLKRHVEFIHLEKKPFSCEICNRKFASKQNLIEHRHIHTKSKPHSCIICEKKFRQLSMLSLHKKTHDNDYESTLRYAIEFTESKKLTPGINFMI